MCKRFTEESRKRQGDPLIRGYRPATSRRREGKGRGWVEELLMAVKCQDSISQANGNSLGLVDSLTLTEISLC